LIAIAKVPQVQILSIDFFTEDSPAFAAVAPEMEREIIEKPYCEISISYKGANIETNKGTPPAMKKLLKQMPPA
jgi:hypothetical protein